MDLSALARTQLDDTDQPPLRSDELLLEYLREAVVEACTRSRFYLSRDLTPIDVLADATEITLPTGIQEIDRALFRRPGFPDYNMELTNVYEMDRRIPHWRGFQPAAVSRWLSLDETFLKATPIPSPANDAQIVLEAWIIPNYEVSDITFGDWDAWLDSLPIPRTQWRDLLHWIQYRAYQRRDEETYSPQMSTQHLALFNVAFGEKRNARVIEQERTRRTRRVTPHYF